MSKNDIRQFRLSTGEQIICEVLEWDDEETSSVLARGILKIIETDDWKAGVRLIAFRPFMSFNEDPDIIQTINSEHVIAESTPAVELLKLYMRCIKKVKDRAIRLLNKQEDGVDPKNDNSRAIALRYDNMRRMMTSNFL